MEKRKIKVFERTYPQGWSKPCVTKEIGEGVFHGWGCGYDEFESGPGNYTFAIVEMPDGSVLTPLPTDVKFVDGEKNSEIQV